MYFIIKTAGFIFEAYLLNHQAVKRAGASAVKPLKELKGGSVR
jgi:hypothetical protein